MNQPQSTTYWFKVKQKKKEVCFCLDVSGLQREKEKIMENKRQVKHLVSSSKNIVRLKPRNPEEKSSSIVVKALCDFKQDQVSVFLSSTPVAANTNLDLFNTQLQFHILLYYLFMGAVFVF